MTTKIESVLIYSFKQLHIIQQKTNLEKKKNRGEVWGENNYTSSRSKSLKASFLFATNQSTLLSTTISPLENLIQKSLLKLYLRELVPDLV